MSPHLSTPISLPLLQIVSYAHLHPGMPLTVSVTSIEDYGLLVTAGPGIKGIVPKLHASDLGAAKALLKFKVCSASSPGNEVMFIDYVLTSQRLEVSLCLLPPM